MKLSENQVIEALRTFLDECDADELARLTGEIFGGDCHWFYDSDDSDFNNSYEFKPNDNYCGQFGDDEEGELK